MTKGAVYILQAVLSVVLTPKLPLPSDFWKYFVVVGGIRAHCVPWHCGWFLVGLGIDRVVRLPI